MRSIAETGKDGPLALTAAVALVVGQCCLIALQLLRVPFTLWMRLRQRHTTTARRRSTPDQASRWFSAQPLPKFKGFYLQKFFLTWYHFFTEDQPSFLPCGQPFVLTLQEEGSIRNRKKCIIFKVPSLNSGALAVRRQPKISGAATYVNYYAKKLSHMNNTQFLYSVSLVLVSQFLNQTTRIHENNKNKHQKKNKKKKQNSIYYFVQLQKI